MVITPSGHPNTYLPETRIVIPRTKPVPYIHLTVTQRR